MRVVTVALVVSSVVLEWLFLTGTPFSARALADAFLPQPAATPVEYIRPDFQTGMIFPRWGQDSYTSRDPNYAIGLGEIQQQTGARWVELTILFSQTTRHSTTIYPDPLSATPASLAAGIEAAHARGFKVFVEPLISLAQNGPGPSAQWSGNIGFPQGSEETALWFQNYWQALEPYMVAGQHVGVDQMAIGAELAGLESHAPANDWYWLIAQARSVYSGRLTYDMNFTSLTRPGPVPVWMTSPSLTALGVSLYSSIVPLANEPVPLSSIPERWAATAGATLDAFAERAGRPMVISEIGYRATADAGYRPFQNTSQAGPDPELQAALYSAATTYALSDPHVEGIYFWAWSLPPFSPNWSPAARALKSLYNSPLA
jgi:hypothetical protein